MNIDNLTITRIAAELRLAADNCPKCAGSREVPFISRGRENIVNCLLCESIHKFLEPIEAALEILTESQENIAPWGIL